MALVEAQVVFPLRDHPADDQGFSHVVQDRAGLHGQLLEHPVGQALEA